MLSSATLEPAARSETPVFARPADLAADLAPDQTRTAALALAGADVILMAFSLLAAALVWGPALSLMALTPLPLLHTALRLYPGFAMPLPERLQRRWLGGGLWLLAGLAATAPIGLSLPLLTGGLIFLAGGPLCEDAMRHGLRRRRRWGRPALVLPSEDELQSAITLQQNWQLGLIPVLSETAGTLPLTTAVASPRTDLSVLPPHVTDLFIVGDGGILTPVQAPALRWLPSLRPRNPMRGLNAVLKRLMDITGAILALLPALPVMLIAAVAIRRRDPGPILFRQTRRGLQGRDIKIWKLRSMYTDSAQRLERLLAENPAAAAEWTSTHKLRHDPRILPGIGHFIRTYSIDELPQLLNVLTGELTLVGPRVFPAYDITLYDAYALALRDRVKPGLTGLWQVSVRSDGNNLDKVRYDVAYITNWTLWNDLDILYRTVGAVLGGRGAG